MYTVIIAEDLIERVILKTDDLRMAMRAFNYHKDDEFTTKYGRVEQDGLILLEFWKY